MNHTAIQTYKPPQSCIQTAFRSSGKSHLVLTENDGCEDSRTDVQNSPFTTENSFVVNLDRPFGNSGCVIMASGLGQRFGGNKLMADFKGKPLIQWILDTTDGIFFSRVVVTRHEDVKHLCEAQGISVVYHSLPFRNDTVRLGLQAVGDVDFCAFCPGDQPLLSKETLSSLALGGAGCRDMIWRTSFGDTVGSPVLFPKWAYPELLSLPEGKGGNYVVKKYPDQVKTIPVRDMYELKDIDCPSDLTFLSNL